MMKTFKKALALGLSLLMAASLCACSKEPEVPSSSVPESSAPPSAPESSEPVSSWFVPAGDLIPSGPEEGSEGFEAAFSQNSIDKQYDADYDAALSFSMMREACETASARWKDMIDTAYQAVVEVTPSEELAQLQQEQNEWSDSLNGELERIQEEAGEGDEGILTAARQTVLLYRQRAMELCRIKYEADGELPEFPSIP